MSKIAKKGPKALLCIAVKQGYISLPDRKLFHLCQFRDRFSLVLQDVIHRFLSVPGSLNDKAVVRLEFAEPALDISRRVVDGLVLDAAESAEVCSSHLRYQFFHRIILAAKPVVRKLFVTI